MILAIVGTRDWDNKNRVYFEIAEYRKTNRVEAIVSLCGTGRGNYVDKYVKEYCKEHTLRYMAVMVDWQNMTEPCIEKVHADGARYNALAPSNAAHRVAAASHGMLAFWDLLDTNTQDAISKSQALNRPVKICKIGC